MEFLESVLLIESDGWMVTLYFLYPSPYIWFPNWKDTFQKFFNSKCVTPISKFVAIFGFSSYRLILQFLPKNTLYVHENTIRLL
jgi:hypothetical protein